MQKWTPMPKQDRRPLGHADPVVLDVARDVAGLHGRRSLQHAVRPVLFNAVIAFEHYPDVHKKQLQWLGRCRQRGLAIYGQGFTTDAGHTYSFEDWNLYDEMPAWREATTGSLEERLAKLSDPLRRPALRDSKPYLSGAFEDIVVAEGFSPETQKWQEWQIRDIAEQLRKHPVDTLLDLACADDLATVFFSVRKRTCAPPSDTPGRTEASVITSRYTGSALDSPASRGWRSRPLETQQRC